METRKLAPVYLDNQPVGLEDAKPQVSKILSASGKRPESVEVRRLMSQSDPQGKSVRLEDVIDRTASFTTPIYLKSVPLGGRGGSGSGPSRSDSSNNVGGGARSEGRNPTSTGGKAPIGEQDRSQWGQSESGSRGGSAGRTGESRGKDSGSAQWTNSEGKESGASRTAASKKSKATNEESSESEKMESEDDDT